MKKKIQKPFDAEAAKGGAKVETRDGDSVRILCYDRKSNNKHINFPIIALTNHNGTESCFSYTSEGRLLGVCVDAHDLVIIEEVEVPKFSVGNWLVPYNEDLPRLITAVTSDCYELEDVNGHKVSICHRTIENLCRLWTLKDAKPGDVLISEDGKHPFIFKKFLGYDPSAYCGIDTTDSIDISDEDIPWTNDPVRPATYKERHQFFKKVEEDGYRWYPESLTLSEIKKRWVDKEDAEVKGYFINSDSHIEYYSGHNIHIDHNIFATEKQAKSALAMARISQIIANDIRFGGPITDEEWVTNNLKKFTIRRINGRAVFNTDSFVYNFLAFHTAEQRQLFWEENDSLIKDYLMIKDNFTLAD